MICVDVSADSMHFCFSRLSGLQKNNSCTRRYSDEGPYTVYLMIVVINLINILIRMLCLNLLIWYQNFACINVALQLESWCTCSVQSIYWFDFSPIPSSPFLILTIFPLNKVTLLLTENGFIYQKNGYYFDNLLFVKNDHKEDYWGPFL